MSLVKKHHVGISFRGTSVTSVGIAGTVARCITEVVVIFGENVFDERIKRVERLIHCASTLRGDDHYKCSTNLLVATQGDGANRDTLFGP